MIKVSVLGATGYGGYELVKILSKHPQVDITHIVTSANSKIDYSIIYPNLNKNNNMTLEEMDIDKIVSNSDIVFTALPHGASKEIIPILFEKKVKIIDFSGYYRYNNAANYEKWYSEPHYSPELLQQSVYGLTELNRNDIEKATLIGNPGSFTTCAILSLLPLIKNKMIDLSNIIIDAKAGITVTGSYENFETDFCSLNESVNAYKIATHRHTSEIEQELSIAAGEEVMLSFTPHLVPMQRGILTTSYANLNSEYSVEEITESYKSFYKNEYFIRILEENQTAKTSLVRGSNFVDISVTADTRLNRVIVVACLDNLIKGAAGQAVQNMNLMFGFSEKMGIDFPGNYL